MNYSLIILASAVSCFLAIHTAKAVILAKAVTPAKAGVSFAYWNILSGILKPNQCHTINYIL